MNPPTIMMRTNFAKLIENLAPEVDSNHRPHGYEDGAERDAAPIHGRYAYLAPRPSFVSHHAASHLATGRTPQPRIINSGQHIRRSSVSVG